MKKYTLSNLIGSKGLYYFGNSPVGRSTKEAKRLLDVINFLEGELTDTIGIDCMYKICRKLGMK